MRLPVYMENILLLTGLSCLCILSCELQCRQFTSCCVRVVINSSFSVFNKQYDSNCKSIVHAMNVYCAHQTWATTNINSCHMRSVNSSRYYFKTGMLIWDAIGVIWRCHIYCENDGGWCRFLSEIDRKLTIRYLRVGPASGNCRVSSQLFKKVLRHVNEYKH